MDDLDRDLLDLGRKWRDSQTPHTRVDSTLFVESTRRTSPSLSRLVGVMAIVAVLGVGIVAIGQDLQMTRRRADPGHGQAVPGQGAEVTATGVVVVDRDGVARICDPLAVRAIKLSQDQPAECSGIAVLVLGLEVEALPGWAERGTTGSSDVVSLTGIWTGDAIATTAVVPAPTDSKPRPEVPCLSPNGGWPDAPADEPEFETALSRLGVYLAAEPARFSGYWLSSGANAEKVVVVGVVDNPEAARVGLETVYPYPLCVARVEYSAIDLDRAAISISQDLASRPTGSWRVRMSQPLNRVSVRIPIVDDAIARLLEQYPEAEADPLAQIA